MSPPASSIGPFEWRERDGRDLHAVWTAATGEYFAVGEAGGVTEWNGATWLLHDTGRPEWLYAVWGSAADDVFAAGERGVVLHYDGADWTTESLGLTTGIWDLWGSAPDRILAVGDDGFVLMFDGSAWQEMSTGTTKTLRAVWGVATGEIFIGGDDGTVLRYDGASWIALTPLPGRVQSLWASAVDDVWAATTAGVWRHDGSQWTDEGGTRSASAIRGRAPRDVVTAGSRGMFEYDGGSWTPIPISSEPLLLDLSLGGNRNEGVAVGDGGAILHGNGSEWTAEFPAGQTALVFMSVSGRSADDLYVAGWRSVWRFDGVRWSPIPVEARAVWAAPGSDRIFIGGPFGEITLYGPQGEIETWAQFNRIDAFWGSSDTDVYAIDVSIHTGEADLLHYDGSAWSSVSAFEASRPTGVMVFSATDVAVVGYRPVGVEPYLARFDGQAWSFDAPAPPEPVSGVWGTAWDDLFAAGDRSIHHFDGATWTVQSTNLPVGGALLLTGINPVDVFAVGETGFAGSGDGILFAYDGTTWMEEARFGGALRGVWSDARSGQVFLVGELRNGRAPLLVRGLPVGGSIRNARRSKRGPPRVSVSHKAQR